MKKIMAFKWSKIDRNYFLVIGFWFVWKLTTTFIAILGIIYFNNYLTDHTFVRNIYRVWDWWDGGYFHDIVATGYNQPVSLANPHPVLIRTAFFPLFPLLMKFFTYLVGGNIELAQYLAATLCFFIWIVLFYYFLKRFICPKNKIIAVHACILAIVFPYNLFFAAGYAESLMMIFVILFFIAIYKKNYILAAVSVALASISRFVGVGLLLILLVDILISVKKISQKIFYTVISTIISLSLLVVYSIYLQVKFGKWDWYIKAEASYDRYFSWNFIAKYYNLLKTDLIFTNHHDVVFANDVFNLTFLLLALAIAVYFLFFRRKYLYFGLYILVILGPAILNGKLLSMARFSIVCFPIYFFFAEQLYKRSIPLWFLTIPTASVQAILIVAFTGARTFIG